MQESRFKVLMLAGFLVMGVLLGANGSPAHAADHDYPKKPISIIIGVPPGGSTDMAVRALARFMEKELKQTVVVVNKPGAAGTLGGYAVASAKPDGYTLGYFPGSASAPELFSYFYSAPYSSKDLKPIARVHVPVISIAVKGDAPWNTLKEFVDYAKKNPGTKFGHLGKSTTQYLSITSVAKAEQIKLIDVPFDGDSTMIPALVGGHIPIATPVLYVVKPLMAGKKVKVLAVALRKRAPSAPDIPTLPELGYKLPYVPFFGLFAPKDTPAEIVRKLEDAVRKVVANEEFLKLSDSMDIPVEYEDAAHFEQFMVSYKAAAQAFFKEQGLVK